MTPSTCMSDGRRDRPRLSITLSAPNSERVRAIAEDTGRPVSRVLDDFLTSRFLHEDRIVGKLGDEKVLRMARGNDALRAALADELVTPDDVLALAITLMDRRVEQ